MNIKKILGITSTGLLLQGLNAILSLIKVPIVIQNLGQDDYVGIATTIAFWSYLSFQGEVTRKSSRVEFATDGSWLRIQTYMPTFCISVVVGSLLLSGDVGQNALSSKCFDALLLGLFGLTYAYTARSIGVLEGRGQVNLVNTIQIISQVVTFPFFLLAAYSQNYLLVVLSFLFSYTSAGLVLFFYCNLRMPEKLRNYRSFKFSNWNEITLWELVPVTLFPFIVSRVSSEESALHFFVYQKFSILFAVLPVALLPITSTLKLQKEKKKIKGNLYALSIAFLLPIISIIIFFHHRIISFVSAGSVTPSPLFLLATIFSGTAGVLTSQIQNSASSGIDLKIRLRVLRQVTPISMALIIMLNHYFQSYWCFIVSGLISLCVTNALRRGKF